MRTSILKLENLLITAVMALLISLTGLFTVQAYAQAADSSTVTPDSVEEDHSHEEDHQDDHSEAAQSPEADFDKYTVIEGDNLTKLVRRSVMNYDDSNESVELSSADVVYIETNVVQQMQCDVIYPGQEISIDKNLIASYSGMSNGLSTTQQQAWAVYANNAGFVFGDRTAEEAAAISSTTVNNEPSGSGEVQEEGASGDGDGQAQEEGEEPSNESTDDESDDKKNEESSSSNIWPWVIGGLVIAGGWAYLGKRDKK